MTDAEFIALASAQPGGSPSAPPVLEVWRMDDATATIMLDLALDGVVPIALDGLSYRYDGNNDGDYDDDGIDFSGDLDPTTVGVQSSQFSFTGYEAGLEAGAPAGMAEALR